MSTLIQCLRLAHSMGTRPLFADLDLTIDTGDRIGLVGHNGSGKSTLLSLLNGVAAPDTGEINRSKDLRLETVEQFIDDHLLGFGLADALAAKLRPEERAFGDYKVSMLLHRLGFSDVEFDYTVGDLSGGQQNRLMFARAVINAPNLILFDEPTNHLDLRTLLYFESFLATMDAGYLLISHDRQFLDAVTNRTLFLRDGRLYSFDLPYSEAKARLDEQDESAAARRKVEEKNIQRLRASAKRLAIWGKVYDNEDLARKAKTMEKRIEKLEAQKTFVTRGSGLSLTLDVQQSRANRMDTLRAHCNANDNDYKGALIKAGFAYPDHDKQVGVMSGGERARLMFLIIRLNKPNFLILDEPTNHIDIQGKEELEAQILETEATVLITSHDRRFVDNIAERFMLIRDSKLLEINDPQAFYSAAEHAGNATGTQQRDPLIGADDYVKGSEELLERLVELERLLEDDLARKPKFQKPRLQAEWRAEIDALTKRLE